MFLFLEIYSTILICFSRYPKKMDYFRGGYSLLAFSHINMRLREYNEVDASHNFNSSDVALIY